MTELKILTEYEIDIIDSYVIRNNTPTMNLAVFRNIVDCTLPLWRSEQLSGMFYVDDNGIAAYEEYKNFRR